MDITITRSRASDFAKAMRASLARQGVTVSHAAAMTTLANMLGFAETRAMVAGLPDDRAGKKRDNAIPIVRLAAYHAGGRSLLLDAAPALALFGPDFAARIVQASDDQERRLLIDDILPEMEPRRGYEAITPFLDAAGTGDHAVDIEICRSDVAAWLKATGHESVECTPTTDSWAGAFEQNRAVLLPGETAPDAGPKLAYDEVFDELVAIIQSLSRWDARELRIWLYRIADEGSTEDTAAVLRYVLADLENREADIEAIRFSGGRTPAHSILERLSFRPGASRSWAIWLIRRLIAVLDRSDAPSEDELLLSALREGVAAHPGK